MTKARILVVEDEAIIAQDIKGRLEKQGYEVPSVVATGRDAVEKAKEDRPALVLMDIVLPGEMDGIEAAGVIRSQYDVPVVYLTAYSDDDVLRRAIETEPFGYITKPFEDSDLTRTIEMGLFKHRMEQKLRAHVEEVREKNTALKVLLEQREKDKEELEEKIMTNIRNLILPYLDKLKTAREASERKTFLEILETNLEQITSSFSKKLSSRFHSFTPQEIRIANLVKEGRQDKEIMEILNISFETVKSHRQNIRKKLGIYGERKSLRAHLTLLTD